MQTSGLTTLVSTGVTVNLAMGLVLEVGKGGLLRVFEKEFASLETVILLVGAELQGGLKRQAVRIREELEADIQQIEQLAKWLTLALALVGFLALGIAAEWPDYCVSGWSVPVVTVLVLLPFLVYLWQVRGASKKKTDDLKALNRVISGLAAELLGREVKPSPLPKTF